MNIEIAKNAGFCFGVKRAVQQAENYANTSGSVINTYGELIHNPDEIKRLEALGLIPVKNIDEISGNRIIIRTHGVGKAVMEELISRNIEVIDLTCPFVKKIHNIVNECSKNTKIIIIGDAGHPEVQGILGWCQNGIAVSSAGEVKNFVSPEDRLCVVSQTTADRVTYTEIKNEILKINPDAVIHDTICSATNTRLQEALALASECGAMLVIGGKNSSNTKKLFKQAKSVCENTHHIENAGEIDFRWFSRETGKVGITAGASTPDHIIKEVFITMTNLKNQEDLNFEEMLDDSLQTLNTGDTVTGTVVDIRPTEVVLELKGCKYNGIIDLDNLTDDPAAKPSEIVSKGDEIEAFVIQVDDNNGQVRLSKKKLEQEQNFIKLQSACESGEILTGKVVDILEKGVIASCLGSRVFIPASHASDRYMADLSSLKDQEFPMRIIEVAGGRRRKVVASIKSVLKEQKEKLSKEFWENAEIGKTYEGTVKSITPFGVFVDIGGVDGLVHISELSWKKISHPSQVVKEGDTLEVFIKALDPEKQKISLGYKKDEDNPWTKFTSNHQIGDIVNGTVVRLVPFGAFVEVDGVDGLIHISELSWRRITHPSEVLKEGQVVEVIIKDIDSEKQKISLGYKRIEDNPWEIFKKTYSVGDTVKCKVVRIAAFGAFAEILEGVDGLIHISQISDKHIATVNEALSIGDEVEAKIIDIKPEEGKISLSIRALIEENAAPEDTEETEEEAITSVDSAEDAPTAFEAAVEAAEKSDEAAE